MLARGRRGRMGSGVRRKLRQTPAAHRLPCVPLGEGQSEVARNAGAEGICCCAVDVDSTGESRAGFEPRPSLTHGRPAAPEKAPSLVRPPLFGGLLLRVLRRETQGRRRRCPA
jgi:hypothetical protein